MDERLPGGANSLDKPTTAGATGKEKIEIVRDMLFTVKSQA